MQYMDCILVPLIVSISPSRFSLREILLTWRWLQHIAVLPQSSLVILDHTQSLGSFRCPERRKFKEDGINQPTLEQLDRVQHTLLIQHERPFIYLIF